jgi:hypothetical protein
MLLMKPYVLRREHLQHVEAGYTNLSHENLNAEPSPSMDIDRNAEGSGSGGHEEMNHEEVNEHGGEVTPWDASLGQLGWFDCS